MVTCTHTTEWNISRSSRMTLVTPHLHTDLCSPPKAVDTKPAALWRVEAVDRQLPRALLALSAAAQQEMPRLRAYQWALSSGTHLLCSGQINTT